MHDFFEILGVPNSARAVEVRRLCAGHVRRWHPDFEPGGGAGVAPNPGRRDVAIDFVEMAPLVDRMRDDFFGTRSRR